PIKTKQKRFRHFCKSQGVFCDVQEYFWVVKKVLYRFDEWRGAFSESYISLCLPKLLNPFIRHQLLGWNPLQAAGEDFEALPWYSAVETFCHGLGYREAEHTDRKTLPAIIEKTLLPKIQRSTETHTLWMLWDPLSSRQSVCLSELCRRLRDHYSLFEGESCSLSVPVLSPARLDDDIFIPHYPKEVRESTDAKSSPQRRFRDQQFWTAVKVTWDGLIPGHTLKELMLDKLLNCYLMMSATQRDPNTGLSMNVESIFDDVCNVVSITCRAVASDVLTVLGSIKAWDKVLTISDKYHYKDLVDTRNLSYCVNHTSCNICGNFLYYTTVFLLIFILFVSVLHLSKKKSVLVTSRAEYASILPLKMLLNRSRRKQLILQYVMAVRFFLIDVCKMYHGWPAGGAIFPFRSFVCVQLESIQPQIPPAMART
uniref:GCF C-terminal domain-containing protein n=1 Tax=Hucho hucho TaxID=62062 RepID=A0A4W5RWK6_9TELE